MNRGVQGDEPQRLFFRESAVAHRLRGLDVEAARALVRVGVDGDDDAVARHDGGVVRDGVVGLHLVAPEVREGRGHRAVARDLRGNLVAFEHVLKSPYLEAELVCDVHQHEDFVGAVAVRVNKALAFEDFDERVEFQVLARRYKVLLAARHACAVVVPTLLVLGRAREGVADGLLDAHARGGAAGREAGHVEVRALRVFAERELDAGRRAGHGEVSRRVSPLELDRGAQAAD